MNDTPNLALPYILPAQAQKHVTHNEAIRALDCIVQLSVESRSLTVPPATPADGKRYIVATGATGAWAGESDKIAAYQDGAWMFYEPQEGWFAWVADDLELVVHSAGTWATFSAGGGGGGGPITELDSLSHLGVNTTADTTNRVALKSPASLFDNDGNGHQQKINKHAAGDTASVLYQTNYSGRAEIGLTGDDDFHFKVSPDGSTWYEGIKINRTSGRVSFPSGGVREVLSSDRTYYVRTDGNDSNKGFANTSSGAWLTLQRAVDVLIGSFDFNGYTVTLQVGDGTYTLTSSVAITSGVGIKAPSNFVIKGNTATPGNVVINQTAGSGGAACFAGSANAVARIMDMKLTSAAQRGLYTTSGASFEFGNVEFGACGDSHMVMTQGGFISAISDYKISGGAGAHILCTGTGVALIANRTITLTGTPNFSNAFAVAVRNGEIDIFSNTFSGSATGVRYSASNGGGIFVLGAGANALPGSSAGTAVSPGWYA